MGFGDWAVRIWERHAAPTTGETAEERARRLAEAETALQAAKAHKHAVDKLTAQIDQDRIADAFAPLIADALAATERRSQTPRKKHRWHR